MVRISNNSAPTRPFLLCLTTKADFFHRLSQAQLKQSLMAQTLQERLFAAYHVPDFTLRIRRAAKRRYINQWGTKKVVCLRVLGPVARALP